MKIGIGRFSFLRGLAAVAAMTALSVCGVNSSGGGEGFPFGGFSIIEPAMAAPADEAVQQQQKLEQYQKQKDDAAFDELTKTRKTPPKQKKKAKEQAAPVDIAPRQKQSRAEKDRCFKIKKVALEDAALLSASTTNAIIAPFENSCVGLKEIAFLIRSLTAAYIEKGYVTSRVYIPEQNIKKAQKLRLAVVEGKTEAIKFNTPQDGTERQVATAFPELVGKPLNLRDLEQGIDQLNRLASNDAKLKIAPGTKPGQSIVNLSNKTSKRWGLSLDSDNLGQNYTGRYKGRISPYIDNLLGLNDHLSFGYERSSVHRPFRLRDRKRFGETVSGALSIPYGYWTLYLDGSYYHYKSFVPGAFSDLETSGESEQLRATLDRVVHRDQVSKTSLSASLTYKETENLILGNRIETGSRALTVANFSITHTRAMLGGSWAFSASYERGLDWFGALDDRDQAEIDPRAQFDKVLASLSLQRPFKINEWQFIYHGLLSGQYSDDRLFGSEQTSLGGYHSIRGFRESVTFGNNGLFSRNELELYLPAILNPKHREIFGQFSVFGAVDYGRIYGRHEHALETEDVAGWAAGIRSSYGKLDFELAVSEAIEKPDFVEDETLIYARGGVNF